MMTFYDYSNRQGIYPLSWNEVHSLCKGLVRACAPYEPEVILPVARGGLYPGTLMAHLLRCELYPVRVSRRVKDVVTYAKPRWLLKPPRQVKNHRVLIVDEMCGAGETITVIKKEAERMGAAQVRSAVLYAHTWGVSVPDYIGFISDALVLNPWDREIYMDGDFVFHPEYVAALAEQGLSPEPSLLLDTEAVEIAKGEPPTVESSG